MTFFPTSTDHSGDGITVERASIETGLPVELINQAIEEGDLSAGVLFGFRIVRRSEAKPWARQVKAQAWEAKAWSE